MPLSNSQEARAIVLVEDEFLVREILTELLESEAFKVYAFECADEALPFIKNNSLAVKLLLTDINMPGEIDGGKLANLITILFPEIPIVVMSGRENLDSAKIVSSVKFIRKPFQFDEILDAIYLSVSKL